MQKHSICIVGERVGQTASQQLQTPSGHLLFLHQHHLQPLQPALHPPPDLLYISPQWIHHVYCTVYFLIAIIALLWGTAKSLLMLYGHKKITPYHWQSNHLLKATATLTYTKHITSQSPIHLLHKRCNTNCGVSQKNQQFMFYHHYSGNGCCHPGTVIWKCFIKASKSGLE